MATITDPGLVTLAPWVTSRAYLNGQEVTNFGSTYTCLVDHTSGTFATDLAAGKWKLTPDFALGDQSITLKTVALAKSLTVDGLATGSEVRFTRNDTGAVLYIGTASAGRVQFVTKYDAQIDIEVRKADVTPFYKPWFGSVTLTADITVTALQIRED